ncbi:MULTISPECIES: alpha/beta hydrolase [unclassified Streptomyces]|uniref:alpha/beta hydrolase n=1 Tax=unclassified Streptomyces TaxID=2593676 RepID=UPI0011C70452|nr:alpha/beta hydrolase [Streptomyces sp. wa22]TXS17413.1 alpha/beta hydrolase [Streptomyces sp. wa22]WSQ79201.1 alpha/beta hydrolase [Streptomyces sp. NBC_01213]
MPVHPLRALMVGRRRHAAVVAAVLSCSTALTGQGPVAADGAPIPSVPAPHLDWRPCIPGSPFDCATTKVPLDHADPGGRSIDLAVVRRKATGPGQRVGTLFFNPGGPGGPGTVQMPQNYSFFPREVRERFDIISWDPRGIGNSTAVNCFTSPEEAADWNASKAVGFPVGEKEQKDFTAAYADLARRCEKKDPELLRHVSTADTARDLDQLRRSVGEPQLNYYGISYGTILGATYANLFPGKVRTMTLDSNIGPQAWTNHASDDARLTTFLRVGSDRSAAATLDEFLDLCGSTTTARCSFSAGTPKATRDKFDRLTQRLRKEPVDTWTYARTVADTVNSLYLVSGWAGLAGRLQELWQGRAPEPAAFPPAPPVPDPNPYVGEEQAAAVLCGDSPNPRDAGVYPSLEEASAARAGDAGRFWTWSTAGCTAWPTSPDRYTGPWDRRTANPVLVVGTTYDPSTAYPNSRAMVEELADARLLTNEGYGHTALLNPSGCVQEHESRYFVDGVLPPAGTTCRQDTPPFTAPKPSGGVATGGGAMAVGIS